MVRMTLGVILALSLFIGNAFAQNFEAIAKDEKQTDVTETRTIATPAATGECRDDPRLEGSILEILNSDAPVNPPLTVTPETFLGMNQEILARLGGQMVICPNNPVMKNGQPMKKVEADFTTLWNAILVALGADDDAAVQNYIKNFTAKRMPTGEVIKLTGGIDLDGKVVKKIYQLMGKKYDANSHPRLVEIYAWLGGKANDNIPVYLCDRDLSHCEATGDKDEILKKIDASQAILLENLDFDGPKRIRMPLRNAGVNVAN